MKKEIFIISYLLFYLAINFNCSAKTSLNLDSPKTDSTINADKKIIVKKVVKEVFTNYLDSILFYKKNFNSMTVMNYIDSYIQRQNDTIETRITNKSYIQRFGSTQKTWIETDFKEVAALIKVGTLDRIKEISNDVNNRVQNILNTISNDKELVLEKEVRNEIKD